MWNHTPEDHNTETWCMLSCSSELCSATFICLFLPICLTCTPISLLTPGIARSCARIGIRSAWEQLLCTHAHMAVHTHQTKQASSLIQDTHPVFPCVPIRKSYIVETCPVLQLKTKAAERHIYIYMTYRTANLQMLHFIYYSTNICTEYFKHAVHSPFFLFKMPFIS